MTADSRIVEEVQRRAIELSAQFGDDPHKYAEHLREIEAEQRERVVDQVIVRSRGRAQQQRPRKTSTPATGGAGGRDTRP